MPYPQLITLGAAKGNVEHIDYIISGGNTPSLTLNIKQCDEPKLHVFFEQHTLLWSMGQLSIRPFENTEKFTRDINGHSLNLCSLIGHGKAAFSRHVPGSIAFIPLNKGDKVFLRAHQMLLATSNIEIETEKSVKAPKLLPPQTMHLKDTLKAYGRDGGVWVYCYGNPYEAHLSEGEILDVRAGAWVYHSETIKHTRHRIELKKGWSSSQQYQFDRFEGPGVVTCQTLSECNMGWPTD